MTRRDTTGWMRACCALVVVALCGGCATTVQRLPGEVKTNAGSAKTACESEGWLVLAPTRYETPVEGEKATTHHDDGVGAYRVGETSAESLPGLRDELGPSPILERHAERVAPHDRDRIISAGLGVGALAALAVGAVLFAGSFETNNVTNADGTRDEEHSINGGKIAAGGILIGAGFGLGIAGMLVAPDASQRAQADADRYVLRPPDDDMAQAKALFATHNQAVRDRCAK